MQPKKNCRMTFGGGWKNNLIFLNNLSVDHRNLGNTRKIKSISKPQNMLVLKQRLRSYRCDSTEILLSEEEAEEDGV